MKRVIIESPYAGNVELYLEYADACILDSLKRGESPIASHVLYTRPGILRDYIPEERAMGIAAGHAWIAVADLMVVYSDYLVSGGMREGIAAAEAAGIPVVYRRIRI